MQPNNFELYIDGSEKQFDVINFPGGEVHIRLNNDDPEYRTRAHEESYIVARMKSPKDVIILLLLTDALKRKYNKIKIDLVMPYIPYARQDRVAVTGESLSIKVFADLINSQNYNEVIVWDAHSDVSLACLNNVRLLDQSHLVCRTLGYFDRSDIVLVCPDNGARKKIDKTARNYSIDKIIYADKKRDVVTGNITGTEITSVTYDRERFYKIETWTEHLDYLIVDDICDGGRTFIELAKVLKERQPRSINLYVTHGIFSNGIACFNGLIDNIYSANIFNEELLEQTNRTKLIKI